MTIVDAYFVYFVGNYGFIRVNYITVLGLYIATSFAYIHSLISVFTKNATFLLAPIVVPLV